MDHMDQFTCTGCGEEKRADKYGYFNTRWGKRRRSLCKPCYANRQHLRQLPGARNRRRVKQKYGLTPEQITQMGLDRDSRCDICGQQRRLHVDHDHETQKIRGMLCFPCNVSIGHFQDDPQLLRKAIEYLEDALERV